VEFPEELRYVIEQYDIDVNEIISKTGSSRITEKEVTEYIREKYYPRVKTYKRLDPIRRTISRRLSQSYREAVHVTLFKSIDVGQLLSQKEKLESYLGGKVSFTFMLLKPVANVLVDSVFNSELKSEDQLVIYQDVNIGIAVATERGLVSPVIRRVDEKDVRELYVEFNDLVTRARNNKLKQKDLVGATFTITNLGMYGIDHFTQIINPPQTAIMGVGRIRDEISITQEGGFRVSKVATFSLTFDHRIADGADAAVFLNRLNEELSKFKY